MSLLCLLGLLSSAAHCFLRALQRSGIRFGALAAGWQPAEVADAAVALDVLQSLDISGNFALEVAFYLEAAFFYDQTDLVLFIGGHLLCLFGEIDAGIL